MDIKAQKSPNYLIIEHFDQILVKLNQHVDTLNWPTKEQYEKDRINRQRDYLVDLIKIVRDFNINEIDRSGDAVAANEEKIKHLIEIKDNLSFIKTCFIKNDCYLVRDLSSCIFYSLIVTNWFINNEQIEFFNKIYFKKGKLVHDEDICIENIDQNELMNIYILTLENDNQGVIDLRNFKYSELNFLDLNNLSTRTIKTGAFNGLFSLKSLDLSSNELKEINKNAFDDLHKLELLNLSNNQLEINDDHFFKNLINLKTLFLSRNSLKSINFLFRNLINLEELDLSENQLEAIDNSAFMNLAKLKKLSLNSNKLKQINFNIFSNLKAIDIIDLSSNQIEEILNENSILNLNFLKIIYLNKNKLTKLNNFIFDGLLSLEEFHLNENQIKIIENDSFKCLTSLKELNLSDNQLKNFDVSLLSNLVNLEYLNLSFNKLDHIDDCTFKNLIQLKYLFINKNELNMINSRFLNGLISLEELSICENMIKCIETDSFSDLVELKELRLNGNKLSSINDYTFKGLNKLEILNLSYNQIEKIELNSLNNLTKLKKLNLNENKLGIISRDLFSNLACLEEFYTNNKIPAKSNLIGNFLNFMGVKGIASDRSTTIDDILRVFDFNLEDLKSSYFEFLTILKPIAIKRVSDTPGSSLVRNYIASTLERFGWVVQINSFKDQTPFGVKYFSNIIANYPIGLHFSNKTNYKNSDFVLKNRIIFACHYDSKYFSNFDFIGATDSAVSCALLLDLAEFLNNFFDKSHFDKLNKHVQFIFFDGEEAFKKWNESDSLYGSKYYTNMLKKDYQHEAFDTIELFVLLDLIGADSCQFINFFPRTTSQPFKLLAKIEAFLRNKHLLNKKKQYYFSSSNVFRNYGIFGVLDDHNQFLKENVPVLHLIPLPFPSQWHNYKDNLENLNKNNIQDIRIILKYFLMEVLYVNKEKEKEKF